MANRLRSSDVFINCPFDAGYRPVFHAIVFAVYRLGFTPRSALEEDDSGDVRLSKIERIIEQCKYGIHDLSAVELDPRTRLPRFNMPLELGLFLGCKRYGGAAQQRKLSLILDREAFRYRQSISDISGQDIHAHEGDPARAIGEVRDWIRVASRRKGLPGAGEVVRQYSQFQQDLPAICHELRLEPERLTFLDLSETIQVWLNVSR